MLPFMTLDQHVDRPGIDTVLASELGLQPELFGSSCVSRQNLKRLGFGENCAGVPFTKHSNRWCALKPIATFVPRITHIVSVSSEKQMCWVYTGGSVASVANEQSRRD